MGQGPILQGDKEVLANLDRWYSGKLLVLRRAMDNIGRILEGYAKSHHPWTPRTGHTDLSTRGKISAATQEYIETVISAGMDYDVYLELAREGKWAWLYPAVVANEDLIKSIITKAFHEAGVSGAPNISTNIGTGEG